MIACAPPDTSQLVAERLANYLDCQAQSLGANGFSNLAGGWFGPALLWGCLTIYVALIGYRLIFGTPFGPREAVLTTLRAGVVIAFATSWSAYETVIYRVVSEGPAEVASQLLSSDASAPSLPEAAQRLDQDYQALEAVGPNVAAPPPVAPALGGQAPTSAPTPLTAPQAQVPPTPSLADPVGDHAALSLIMLIVGSLGALKLAGGLLLGTGPVFVTLGLFDATLGVLVGWLRALIGLFVGTTGAMCVTALELGFIEAQLPEATVSLGARDLLGEPTLMAAAQLFTIAMTIILVAALVIGCSLRIRIPLIRPTPRAAGVDEVRRSEFASATIDAFAFQSSGRAQTVADAIRRIGEREGALDAEWGTAPRVPALRQSFGASGDRASTNSAGGLGRGSLDTRRRGTRGRTPSVERRDRL